MPRRRRAPLTSATALLISVSLNACQGHGPPPPSGPGGPPDAARQAAFDPAAVGPGAPPRPAPGRPLDVLDYGPIGRTEGNTQIHVRFNQPVVALGLDDPTDYTSLFSFDPPLSGRAYFKSPELLVFDPDEDLRDCQGYTARFAGGLTGLGDQKFERPLTWNFETTRPTVISSHPNAGEADLRRDSAVFFQLDRPAALAEVRAHVTASARPLDGGEAIAVPVTVRPATRKEMERHFYVHGSDVEANLRRIYAVKASELWPVGSEVTVAVTPGLVSEAGPLWLDTPWSMAFKTYRVQGVESLSCAPDQPCGLEPIRLTLRNPILEREARKISVSPRPKGFAVNLWDSWGEGGREVSIEGMYVPGTTYTVTIPASMRDIFGQSLAKTERRQALVAPKASLAMSSAGGILVAGRPGQPQTIGVESRHVGRLRVRIGVFDDRELRALDSSQVATMPFPARTRVHTVPLTPSGPGDWSSVALDLAALTGDVRRPVLVEVTADELVARAAEYGKPAALRGLFRLTDLGPVAVTSLPASTVQVLRLSDSKPVAGARVSRHDASGALELLGLTDADGHLALPAEVVALRTSLSDEQKRRPVRLVVDDPAHDDRTYLDVDGPYDGNRWRSRADVEAEAKKTSGLRPGERLIARVVSERGVYRPGEKVRVVGWSALDTPFSRSNLGRLPAGTPVKFELVDPYDQVVAVHPTVTTEEGKYWAELGVPGEAKLGRYDVRATVGATTVETTVKVEDYRVPEYTVEAASRRPDILVGESTPIDVRAEYYFGGPVPIRRMGTAMSCRLQRYRPPGLGSEWAVGEPLPADRRRFGDSARVHVPTVTPDPTPGRRLHTSTPVFEDRRYPARCTASFEVQDESLQGIGAEASYNVHPAGFYLALAAPQGLHHAGDRDVGVRARAVDIAGNRVAAGKVELAVTRVWSEPKYRDEGGSRVYDGTEEKTAKVKTCTLDLPAAGDDPTCELPPLQDGRYELAATATAGDGREARTAASFHVWQKLKGRDWRALPPPDRLEISLDRDTVNPGDTLEAVVRGPWDGASGTLVLARGGIREQHPFTLADHAASFKFTADDTWTPGVHMHAFIVTPQTEGTARPRLHEATASVKQDFKHRYLKVQVDAPGKAGPGDTVDLAVHVRDADDRPVAARVALWAVDEAVLDLTDYEVPDLQPDFVPRRPPEIVDYNEFAAILYPFHANPVDPWFDPEAFGLRGMGTGGSGSGYGSGSGAGFGGRGGRAPAPPARSRFETTPVFLADLAVDAAGDAAVKAALPENLTTFRITAVASARLADAASPGRFGKNDARTMVTAPLVLRSVLPRVLRPGDVAEAAAIIQNNTGAPGKVTVTAEVFNRPGAQGQVLKLLSPGTASADMPEGGQVRLPFEVSALVPGAPDIELKAEFTPSAGGPPVHDGMRVPLPVEAERTLRERVAAYGTVDDDQPIAIPVKIPADALPGYGGVTVAATSSLLGGLEDAVEDLVTYPYGCVEQTSSKLLPLVALHDLRQTYPLGVADPALHMRAGVERLLRMQTREGGFGYWPGAADVHAYASAYATWVLHLAQKAGYSVPEDALKKALDDLERRVHAVTMAGVAVDWGYYDGSRLAIALHVLAEADRDVHARSLELYARRQSLPLYARAFLLLALHRRDPRSSEVHTLAGELRGDLQETPATAHTSESTSYDLGEFFHSDARSDAILLMAMLRVEPEHPLVVKLARGLLERRIGGAWRNTQENAYALVALADYARIYEAEVPDFTARAWVGAHNVLDVAFKGREFTTRSSTTDMVELVGLATPEQQALDVVLQREGAGRLYYRLGAEWAPVQRDLPARSQGLEVSRTLRVKEGSVTAGSVTAGEPVAMDITIKTDVRVRYVAIDVPLPAGLEGVSRTLGQGRKAAVLGGRRGWWATHEEQRADRVVVFADDLQPGTHHHTIDLRATTRGKFSFPPIHAEAMYMPEVYGRTAGTTLEVR
ncbi:MAG: hypothetical protein JNL82_15550 [Myxococcales bacterium]|nr:hypothetical protein [Myxococcales bacterium]